MNPYELVLPRKKTLYVFIVCFVISVCFFTGCVHSTHSSDSVPSSSPSEENSTFGDPVSLKDTNNNTITLLHPARRIVSQNGMVAEVLVGIGEGDAMIGTCDSLYSERYLIDKMANIQSIGDFMSPSTERIIALKPDVVIVYANHVSHMERIAEAGIPVMYMDCSHIRDIPRDTRKLGVLTGNKAGAEKYSQFIEKYLDIVDSRLENLTDEERPRVFLESFGADYNAAGRGSSGDSVLKVLKAINIAGNISLQSSIVTPEWVITQNPDVMIKYVSRGSSNLTDAYESIMRRSAIENTSAIRNNRVYVIKTDIINGPRGISGLLYLAKMLYPDRFSDINPAEILKEYARTFVSGSDQIQTYYPSIT